MTPPPLAIIQARMGSTRLPGKMMLPLAGHPLIWHAWRRSIEAFGEENVVVAIPASAENKPLRDYLERIGATVYEWSGPEWDLLGRYYDCAYTFRWRPETAILRVTPDDPLKDPALMKAVAAGVRHPVELSCEGFTLEQLGALQHMVPKEDRDKREHLSKLFPTPAPEPPDGVWTVDTEADYEAMKLRMEA